MKFLILTLLFFTLSITFIFSAKQEVVCSSISSKVLPRQNSNIHPPNSFSRLTNDNRDDLILWYEDFEDGENGWSLDAGWEITETSSNSPTHSVVSPNDNNTFNGSFNLLTPQLLLPEIGVDETMHFGFSLHAELPDSDGDADGYLDDYYNISILGNGESAWHSDDFNSEDGNNFWCADENLNGYLDGWLHYLDTPSIAIGNDGELSARLYYAIESSDGAAGEVEGSCTDGWDAANIRISKDGGAIWALLEDSTHPYHFDCGYGWIFNDNEYETGGTLNHLAKGWGGESGGWLDFSTDLSEFANEEVIIRFAFGSDPAWSTSDDNTLSGLQVDDITVSDNSGILFSNNGEDLMDMTASGEVWIDQFYDYGSIEDDRPGSSGWEFYSLGMPFVPPGGYANVLLDISEFAGKIIKLRIQSRYDDNHDGGQGGGLYIDDFMIYKLSTGAYFAPWDLEAEAGDSEVFLVWADMNAAGTADFVYDEDDFELDISVDGWAGELFDIIGTATINSFKVYNNYQLDTTISVGVYGMFGSTIDTEPIYTKEVPVHFGWNDVNVTNWNMENYFIIAHKISSSFGAAFDTTNIALRSYIRFGEGAWEPIYDYVMEIDGEDVQLLGEFGIRANITYEGAGVTYNVYRDDANIASAITVNTYADSEVENNVAYEYAVSATYLDGEESGQSSSIIVTSLANTIHQESHDDGSFESEFNAGSGNFSAVKYSANALGESVMRFKWYQNGSGGAFYIKVFDDDGGIPGVEIYSAVQASGNEEGWNEKDLTEHGSVDTIITVSGDFWIGTKEFSTSKSFGLDTSSDSGNSYQRTGSAGDWMAINGNLGYHVFLDLDECDFDCAGECGGSSVLDACGICNGPGSIYECGCAGAAENYNCEGNCLESVGVDCFGVCGGTAQNDVCNNCDGGIVNSSNCDGSGCMDPAACNFNELATSHNDSSCVEPLDHYNCLGECTPGVDCTGTCGGIVEYDDCNICDGNENDGDINDDGNICESLNIDNIMTPSYFRINQIYPNPFNPIANIQFEVAEFSQVKLSIINLNGRLLSVLENGNMNPGQYQSQWDGNDSYGNQVSSGIYLAVFESNGMLIQTRKLILLK